MALKKDPKANIHGKTRRYFEYSLVGSLVLVLLAFMFFPNVETGNSGPMHSQEVVNIEEIENTRQEVKPPPPPKPQIPIEAPSDEVIEDVDISSELDLGEQMEPPPPPKPPKEDLEDESYFAVVEDLPKIQGGLQAIQDKVVYPEFAVRAGIEGTVHLLVYIDKKGRVTKVEVLKGIGAGCDEAAIEAVKKVKFTPGKQRGKPVNVKMSIPIRFKLTD